MIAYTSKPKAMRYLAVFILPLIIQACSVFSNPECEVVSHIFVKAKNDNKAYIQVEVLNKSEKDYAYAVQALVKLKLSGSIVEQSTAYYGTLRAQTSLKSNAQFEIVALPEDFDAIDIVLTWKDDGNTEHKKEYSF